MIELPPGPLLLGATHSALMGLLPTALKDWHRTYPHTEIFIQPGDSIPLFNRVAEQELDAAIIGNPNFKLPKTCDWEPLRDEELVLVTPKGLTITDPLEALKTYPFIRFDRSYMVGKLVEKFLQHHNISPKSQFELDGIEVITNFVREGLGVSILPKCRHILRLDASIGYWALPQPVPHRTVGVILARTSVRKPLALALTRILKNI